MAGWEDYIDISGIKPEDQDAYRQALDNVWDDPQSRQWILDAYDRNKGQPIKIHNDPVTAEIDYGPAPVGGGGNTLYGVHERDLSTGGPRTFNDPGQMAISMEGMEAQRAPYYENDGTYVPMSLERILSHELYHLGHEDEDIAAAIRDQMNYTFRDLDQDDIDFLKKSGAIDAQQAADFTKTLSGGGHVGLADVGAMDAEHLNAFIAYGLEDDLDRVRDALADDVMDARDVERLYGNGALTRDETADIIRRMKDGEDITLAKVEQDYGPLPWQELIRYGEGKTHDKDLPADKIDALHDATARLDEHLVTYDTVQLAEEEHTVDMTDEVRTRHGEPPRGEYSNITDAWHAAAGVPSGIETVREPLEKTEPLAPVQGTPIPGAPGMGN